MDRLMRRFGLPGKAFVPLLSAHACALPAIMSTRVIEDRRDRLVTILVAPLMTCSARIPVYTMLIALLFMHEPIKASLTFTGAYAVGVVAAITMAWVFRHTILPGESKPLVIELPHYRLPSLRTALLQMWDRAFVFIRTAGTTILCISVGLWFLASFPRVKAPANATASPTTEVVAARAQLEHSIAGRLGHALEPVLKPLGFDWQIGIGVITSFAAREVIVSTLAVVYGVGSDAAEDHPELTLRHAASCPSGRWHGRVQHRQLLQSAGLLHSGGAMFADASRDATRDGLVEMAAAANRLHERSRLSGGVRGLSSSAPFRFRVVRGKNNEVARKHSPQDERETVSDQMELRRHV